MEEFTKRDYKALHILATYVKENFIDTNICDSLTIDPIDIYNYQIFWDTSYICHVSKKSFSNQILVPRYLSPGYINTKLESLLNFGYEIFKFMDNQKQQNEHWFKYFINKLFCKDNNNPHTYELLKFFRILQAANKQLTLAYAHYPNKPVEWEKVDKVFINHQSHIFLISSLFEMYQPFDELK